MGEVEVIEQYLGQRSGLRVAPASIGAMRFPRDVDDAVTLIRHAIDSGMRYIDTSRGYSESEWLLGEALQDGYREKVILSTKCSPWITKIREDDAPTADCVRRRLEESMRRLRVDYLDFYQVWNIDSREHFEQATAKGGMVEGILKARQEGLIGHTGFTTHDKVENLLSYMDQIEWCEVILFTYNLLNRRYAPAVAAAHKHGIGTIIMNPVGGGRLGEDGPVLRRLAECVGASSVAELAVRFVLSDPNVDTLLCGMQKPQDVDDTVAAADRGPFTADEMAVIEDALEVLDARKAAHCTACRYCMPCPAGIEIPDIMNLVFDFRVWGLEVSARQAYGRIKTAQADACTKCGKCEQQCTQHLPIMETMEFAADECAG
jgi:predicted aldo/keto reductase-like oxidoreductase